MTFSPSGTKEDEANIRGTVRSIGTHIIVVSAVFFRPVRGFGTSGRQPSDQSLGYFRVSHRDKEWSFVSSLDGGFTRDFLGLAALNLLFQGCRPSNLWVTVSGQTAAPREITRPSGIVAEMERARSAEQAKQSITDRASSESYA